MSKYNLKTLFFVLLFPAIGLCQLTPENAGARIDSIFRTFSNTTPGCAVAVMQKGQVVFSKGYGMANLEYAMPITASTVFHIASESKQYVAFCMLMLQKEGKLSLDDDIRKHLDFVPDFGKKITIRQLIHHTSGLRDQWQLLALAGWQLDDVIKQDHVIKLVSQQKELNFDPGSEHMYCNTGYTLMAEILKKVTGLTLRQYTDKYIFQPLGMTNTRFNDDYEELVKNRASSYYMRGNTKIANAVLSYSVYGATSLLTTVEDEAKWLDNLNTGKVGGKDLVSQMLQTGSLNDGRKLNYAQAVAIEKFKGWDMIGHGGSDAGFRTYACRIPEKDLGIIIFSNFGSVNPGGLARRVAEIFVTDSKPEERKEDNAKPMDSIFLKRLQGIYYSERGEVNQMYWKDGKLYRGSPKVSGNPEVNFTSLGNDRYAHIGGGPVMILDKKKITKDSVMEMQMENPTSTYSFKRMPAQAQKASAAFTGRYYSEELEAYYTITLVNDTLRMNHRKFPREPLKNIAPDQFTLPYWWMSHIRFLRNSAGRITGFEVNSGRVQHLKFIKQS